jgi:hypothetical protein
MLAIDARLGLASGPIRLHAPALERQALRRSAVRRSLIAFMTPLVAHPRTASARWRSSNDLWMAIAERFGMQGFTLGDNDQHTTAITGLFA